MNKQRRKMTPEEVKEQEYWRALKACNVDFLRFEMMLKHAGGQCEEMIEAGRCPNLHGQEGITIHGKIILTPKMGRKPILHCQKCGFGEIAKGMEKPLQGKTIRKKENPMQESLI